jgi:hypothetical protein
VNDCTHTDFEATVDVNRLEDLIPLGFSVDVRIVCLGCREPLRFLCPDVGLLPDRPALSVDGTELRIPARASRDQPDPLGMAGYRIQPRRADA